MIIANYNHGGKSFVDSYIELSKIRNVNGMYTAWFVVYDKRGGEKVEEFFVSSKPIEDATPEDSLYQAARAFTFLTNVRRVEDVPAVVVETTEEEPAAVEPVVEETEVVAAAAPVASKKKQRGKKNTAQ